MLVLELFLITCLVILLASAVVAFPFYRLAKRHERKGWLWALLAVVAFCIISIASIAFGIFIGDLFSFGYLDAIEASLYGGAVAAVVLGPLLTWIGYIYLREFWQNNPQTSARNQGE